jgi:hypothetical protein
MAEVALHFILRRYTVPEKNKLMAHLVAEADLQTFAKVIPFITIPKHHVEPCVLDSYINFLAACRSHETQRAKLQWLKNIDDQWVSLLVDRVVRTRALHALPALIDPKISDKSAVLRALGEIRLQSCRHYKDKDLTNLAATIAAYDHGTLYME